MAVLKHHKVLLSDQDGQITVAHPNGNSTEVIPLPDKTVSYRMLQRFHWKYEVPIHYFYHPEALEDPGKEAPVRKLPPAPESK